MGHFPVDFLVTLQFRFVVFDENMHQIKIHSMPDETKAVPAKRNGTL